MLYFFWLLIFGFQHKCFRRATEVQLYVQFGWFINSVFSPHSFWGFFFPFSINFHYFNPPVTFDARNWFLCSFAVYSYDISKPEENMGGQNIIPGKPEEQPANHLVIRAQHNLKCPVRIPGCLMNCAQCAVQGGTSRMEADGSSLRPQIP